MTFVWDVEEMEDGKRETLFIGRELRVSEREGAR